MSLERRRGDPGLVRGDELARVSLVASKLLRVLGGNSNDSLLLVLISISISISISGMPVRFALASRNKYIRTVGI